MADILVFFQLICMCVSFFASQMIFKKIEENDDQFIKIHTINFTQ